MEIKVDGEKLTITATLSSGVPSSTGKSLVVATTNGFMAVAGTDIRVSLNVIKPRKIDYAWNHPVLDFATRWLSLPLGSVCFPQVKVLKLLPYGGTD